MDEDAQDNCSNDIHSALATLYANSFWETDSKTGEIIAKAELERAELKTVEQKQKGNKRQETT